MKPLKHLWNFSKERKIQVASIGLMTILAGFAGGIGIGLLLPVLEAANNTASSDVNSNPLTRVLINGYTTMGIPVSLETGLAGVVIMIITFSALKYAQQMLIIRAALNWEQNIRVALIQAIIAGRWDYLRKLTVAQGTNTVVTETSNSKMYYLWCLESISNIFLIIILISAAAIIAWPAALSIASMGIIVWIILAKLSAMVRVLGDQAVEAREQFTNAVITTLRSLRFIKLIPGTKNAGRAVMDTATDVRRVTYRIMAGQELLIGIFPPILAISLSLALIICIKFVGTPLNLMLVVVAAFIQISPLLRRVITNIYKLSSLQGSIETVGNLLSESKLALEPAGSVKDIEFKSDVVLTDLDYSYDGQTNVIQKANLSMKKGELVVIVGQSGTGKSTLLDLLMGLIAPTKGFIKMDGVQLSKIKRETWANLIGYSGSMEGALFSGTVLENIVWGRAEFNIDDAAEAAKAVGIHDFITTLPDGYTTFISDPLKRLSSGQHQRLSLARAILAKPKLLFLDEPTSALDQETANIIVDTLVSLKTRATMVIATHHQELVESADRIWIVEGGTIKEILPMLSSDAEKQRIVEHLKVLANVETDESID